MKKNIKAALIACMIFFNTNASGPNIEKARVITDNPPVTEYYLRLKQI